MGSLHYGSETFQFDDRTLLHLQIAIHEALRRDHSFFLTWRIPLTEGSGRMSARITPHTPILFQFQGNRIARINRVWIHALAGGALGGTGMTLTPEPDKNDASTGR